MSESVDDYLPIAKPDLTGNELQYVIDAVESSWISSAGSYVDAFEARFTEFTHSSFGVACCNGTAALHLALLGLGIGPGDEVIVPTLTYVASVNAIVHAGATPVLVDSEPQTWNLDPGKIPELISDRTKAIVAVHLYGVPADMGAIMKVAAAHGLYVIEDAAEAHGATVDGRPVGSIGHVGTFSFYGNKILTTGEGGMTVTQDPEIARLMRLFRGQGQDPQRRYWFGVVGYNYRITNVQAAIGLAQLERIDGLLEARGRIGSWYRQRLQAIPGVRIQHPHAGTEAVDWLMSVTVDGSSAESRRNLQQRLADRGIETRPIFFPMHTMPVYSSPEYAARFPEAGFPVAEAVAAGGLSLPTWVGMTEGDVERVCSELSRAID
jgi:perosamine synthetase